MMNKIENSNKLSEELVILINKASSKLEVAPSECLEYILSRLEENKS